ncbi:MAG: type II secretion system major pseudopilin GspG [Planctomycetota bacterium]
MRNSKASRRGFTLIEVLLVVLILVMLAGVGIFALSGTREGARKDTTKLKLEQIASALDAFNMHMYRYPTEEEGLGALRTKPEDSDDEAPNADWRGPYLTEDPKDAWGQDINFQPVEAGSDEASQGLKYKLWSNGPDKQSETEDDIKNYTDPDSGA